MKQKSVLILFKTGISCLLMIALICNIAVVPDLYAAVRENNGAAALANAEITLEVTVKTESGGEEVKAVSGTNLRLALSENGIKRADITCLKVTGGTIKTADWYDICTHNGSTEDPTDDSYKSLTGIVAEEGVEGQDIADRTTTTTFPKSLRTVVLPKGISSIGNYAFYECGDLQQVILPVGVTKIGEYTFSKCSSLQQIEIPEGVEMLMRYAFENCENLQKVKLPDGLRTLNGRAFSECENLQEINFPDGLKYIGGGTFNGCGKLREVVFPDSLQTIEDLAFEKCSGIKEITIPQGVSKLGMGAFEGCTGLEKVTIKEGLQKLEASIFVKCSNLKEITFPNGLILDYEDPPSYRDPLFQPMFVFCQLSTLNIVLKEGETAENMTPVKCMQAEDFGFAFSKTETPALFFYLPDGTMLSDDTEPTVDEVAARYLAEDDGDTTDGLWYGWEIGRSYEVENRLTHLVTSNTSSVWKSSEGDYKAVLSGEGEEGSFYELPEQIHVTIGEKEAVPETDYTYDPVTGEVVVLKASIDGKIVITGEGRRIYHEATVTVKGDGVTTIRTDQIYVSTEQMAELTVAGGDDLSLTFIPKEGCSFVSLTIDGQKQEFDGNTYTIPHIGQDHDILVEFTEKASPPTQSPVPTEVPPQTEIPALASASPASQPPAQTEKPVPALTPVPVASPVPTQTPSPNKDLSAITDGLGVSEETAVKIQAAARELNVSQDTILVTEQTIQSQRTDDDIKGAYFARIQARASQITQKNIKLSWNRVNGADGYEIYGNRCNTKKWIYEYKKMKTIENGNKKSFIDRNCKKGTYYKYIVRAYKIIDGKKVTIAASKTIHVTTTGGKNGNAKSVKINKKKVSLTAGKKLKLRAREIKEDKPLRHHREVSYESGDPNVVTVSKTGRIKAKKRGKCTVFAYAQSGVFRKVKVTVK